MTPTQITRRCTHLFASTLAARRQIRVGVPSNNHQAIEDLNETYASVVTPKSVVVIVSDGWDTGDTALSDRAMAKLSNRAQAIVWINPLKGDANYEPLALGMATARPYCDEFVSGHSVESLRAFARLIDG